MTKASFSSQADWLGQRRMMSTRLAEAAFLMPVFDASREHAVNDNMTADTLCCTATSCTFHHRVAAAWRNSDRRPAGRHCQPGGARPRVPGPRLRVPSQSAVDARHGHEPVWETSAVGWDAAGWAAIGTCSGAIQPCTTAVMHLVGTTGCNIYAFSNRRCRQKVLTCRCWRRSAAPAAAGCAPAASAAGPAQGSPGTVKS